MAVPASQLVIGFAPAVPRDGVPLAHLLPPLPRAGAHLHIVGNGEIARDNHAGLVPKGLPAGAYTVTPADAHTEHTAGAVLADNALSNPSFTAPPGLAYPAIVNGWGAGGVWDGAAPGRDAGNSAPCVADDAPGGGAGLALTWDNGPGFAFVNHDLVPAGAGGHAWDEVAYQLSFWLATDPVDATGTRSGSRGWQLQPQAATRVDVLVEGVDGADAHTEWGLAAVLTPAGRPDLFAMPAGRWRQYLSPLFTQTASGTTRWRLSVQAIAGQGLSWDDFRLRSFAYPASAVGVGSGAAGTDPDPAGMTLQAPLRVDTVRVSDADTWHPGVADGLFERIFTLNPDEPADSWLRRYWADGQVLHLVYTLPELGLAPAEDPLARTAARAGEPADIVDAHAAAVRRTPVAGVSALALNGAPLWSGTAAPGAIPGGCPLESIDADAGLLRFTRTLHPDDDLRVDYAYREDRYVYRGYSDGTVYRDLDLNPAAGHRYHTGVDGIGVPTRDLLSRGVTLYLLPAAAYTDDGAGAVVYQSALNLPRAARPTHFLRHRIDTGDSGSTLSDYPSAVVLSKLFVSPPGALDAVRALDVRERGGGLPTDYDPARPPRTFAETVRVRLDVASAAWLDTGADLLAGDVFALETRGLWWDGGPYDPAHRAARPPLAGVVSDGRPAFGPRDGGHGILHVDATTPAASGVAGAPGRLWVALADADPTDNAGDAYAEATLTRPFREGTNWDVASWDGDPVPLNGVAVLEVPRAVLTRHGGRFTHQDVLAAASRHAAAGVFPLVRYTGPAPEEE